MLQGFNSKLVRLEVFVGYGQGRKVSSFNSKLVRLEEGMSSRLFSSGSERFNSKLVRLEVGSYPNESTNINSFNSKLVRLEVDFLLLVFYQFLRFNSKLVRLEVNFCRIGSHIKNVSIPNWCD